MPSTADQQPGNHPQGNTPTDAQTQSWRARALPDVGSLGKRLNNTSKQLTSVAELSAKLTAESEGLTNNLKKMIDQITGDSADEKKETLRLCIMAQLESLAPGENFQTTANQIGITNYTASTQNPPPQDQEKVATELKKATHNIQRLATVATQQADLATQQTPKNNDALKAYQQSINRLIANVGDQHSNIEQLESEFVQATRTYNESITREGLDDAGQAIQNAVVKPLDALRQFSSATSLPVLQAQDYELNLSAPAPLLTEIETLTITINQSLAELHDIELKLNHYPTLAHTVEKEVKEKTETLANHLKILTHKTNQAAERGFLQTHQEAEAFTNQLKAIQDAVNRQSAWHRRSRRWDGSLNFFGELVAGGILAQATHLIGNKSDADLGRREGVSVVKYDENAAKKLNTLISTHYHARGKNGNYEKKELTAKVKQKDGSIVDEKVLLNRAEITSLLDTFCQENNITPHSVTYKDDKVRIVFTNPQIQHGMGDRWTKALASTFQKKRETEIDRAQSTQTQASVHAQPRNAQASNANNSITASPIQPGKRSA